MMRLHTARFARINQWLEWEKKYGGVFIRIPIDRLSARTLFFVHNKLTFKHLLIGLNLAENRVTYPQGINSQSNIIEFLYDETIPKAIQFMIGGGQKAFLRNKACEKEAQKVKQIVASPDSIYGYLSNYLTACNAMTSSRKYTGSINYFLNQFYMRLTAQTYCKIKGIPSTAMVDEKIKNQILNYIGEQYENDSPAAIKKVQSERDIILDRIRKTNEQIDKLEAECDRRINFYKFGAVVLTAAHIVSFGYMIFFVEWLGWDIIQPLTYSVGVFYTLLGIRFYRKYRTDRTGDTIREMLLKIVMNPTKLVLRKDLGRRLAHQKLQLRRVQARSRLLKNRINFRSSLADAFNQSTTLLSS